MPQKSRATLSWIIGALALIAPIVASVYLAWQESYAAEQALSLTYAQNALVRIEEFEGQFQQAQQKVERANNAPCSAGDLQFMRQVDLASSYLKAIGRVSHDTLLCTSQGVTNTIPLGKPNIVTAQGIFGYFNRKLTPASTHPLTIFESRGFAAVVDPNLAVDVSTEGADIELAVLVPSAPESDPMVTQGQNFPPAWFQPIPPGTQSTTLDHGYLISKVRAPKWDLSVLAATPELYIYQRVGHFAFFVCPLGILCGIVLCLVVALFRRMSTSFPTMLRRAIRDKNFYVLYQPVVDLKSRQIIGAEALVRWKNSYADIRPDFFIPQAEECGLIHLITDRVMKIVMRDLPLFLKSILTSGSPSTCRQTIFAASGRLMRSINFFAFPALARKTSSSKPPSGLSFKVPQLLNSLTLCVQGASLLPSTILAPASRAFRAFKHFRSIHSKSTKHLSRPSEPTERQARSFCT